MKNIILTFIVTLCGISPSFAQTQDETNEALEFHPLDIGTYWVYRQRIFSDLPMFSDTTYYSIEVVADTTLANGTDYAVLRYFNYSPGFGPHHITDSGEDEYGNDIFYVFERVNPETAEVFQWAPTEDDPFNEVLVDSLTIGIPDYYITAERWDWLAGIDSTECRSAFETEVFDQTVEKIRCQLLSFVPVFYNLAKGFGLISIRLVGLETDLILFRDADGNEFIDPQHVNTPIEPEIPTGLVLHTNYPNPFNPTTNISYELPEAADVQLAIFDLSGRKVAELQNGRQIAGLHTVAFDASSMSSGVYIYRIQAGNEVLARKMTLIK